MKKRLIPVRQVRFIGILFTMLLLLMSDGANGACAPMLFGYFDQSSPPYYLGTGTATPEPPGASVDMVREVAASAGCPVKLMRLPATRLQPYLESGAMTAGVFGLLGHDMSKLAVPLDSNGQIDKARSLQQFIVIFVRKEISSDVDPATFLKGRMIGIVHGAPYGKTLRAEGYAVDDGGMDAKSNFEKLTLHRIDAYATALVNADDWDAQVASRYGGALVRLTQPLHASNVWLVFNKAYYESNREQVEQMWNWTAKNANRRFVEILQKYANE